MMDLGGHSTSLPVFFLSFVATPTVVNLLSQLFLVRSPFTRVTDGNQAAPTPVSSWMELIERAVLTVSLFLIAHCGAVTCLGSQLLFAASS